MTEDEPTMLTAPQPMEVRADIAPPRDPRGVHRYPGAPGHNPDDPWDCYTSDCANGCGCWAGPSRSGGPDGLDPFGETIRDSHDPPDGRQRRSWP